MGRAEVDPFIELAAIIGCSVESLRARTQRVVDASPPLTQAQRDRIKAILHGRRPAIPRKESA